jgi:peptidyl-tRNA hydrolase, PTH1 family
LFLVFGLGNPGKKYMLTRHNAGFLIVDALADLYNIQLNSHKFNSECGEGHIAGKKVLLIKPQTYMNNSGEAVSQYCKFLKCPPTSVLVIHDDVDLSPGDIRLKHRGGTAGHHGLDSICELLKTDEFHRLRIGVGRSADPNIDTGDHVLSSFDKEELDRLSSLVLDAQNFVEKTVAEHTTG